ncbi:transposase [Streptomyces cadmiisoli]|uniref:transposase n=1 Tax=Streptomyces cadmiisoli TaxID=2184053 RepID=UPI0013A6AD7B|nr:transposase [Streptomyces cadmiisoli]
MPSISNAEVVGLGVRREVRGAVQEQQARLDAVIAGLSQPGNSGVVEGHVDRIKMLKRQMSGRAGFELLSKCVLLCA